MTSRLRVTMVKAASTIIPSNGDVPASTPVALSGVSAQTLVILAIAGIALSMQLNVFPNHDVSWVLWGADRMLDGARWGVDIIEPNPPLAWLLAMPAAGLAKVSGLPVAGTYVTMVAAAALLAVYAFGRLVSAKLATIVAALFVLPLAYRDFGQREHIALIAALPYLGLVACRLRGDATPKRSTALLIGLVAGIGFALKPYFLAVPLLVEGLVLFSTRRPLAMFRIETIAAGSVGVLYGLSVLLIMRDYVSNIIPLAQSIYWSFDVPTARLVAPLLMPVVCLGVAAVTGWRRTDVFRWVMMAATLGFIASCVIQYKGYSYHRLPVVACAAITLAAAIESRSRAERAAWFATATLALVTVQSLVTTATWWRSFGPKSAHEAEQLALLSAIDKHAGSGRFLVVAVHPYPAFPTALFSKADYVSRTNSQWFLPAVVQMRSRGLPSESESLAGTERNARDFMLYDLTQQPDVVVIDTDSARHTVSRPDFDFLAFYLEDARLRQAWAHYREVERVAGYRLFVRQQGDER